MTPTTQPLWSRRALPAALALSLLLANVGLSSAGKEPFDHVLPEAGHVAAPFALPALSCTPEQNPHTYGPAPASERTPLADAAAGVAAPRPLARAGFAIGSAGIVSVYDLNHDCFSEPVDVALPSSVAAPVSTPSAVRPTDGELDYGVGGGFFPAGHHAATFTVVDDTYATDVRFAVGSDLDGDHRLDCEETFTASGTTTCAAGVDGGWWVIVIGHPDPTTGAISPPTTGRILSGTGTVGSESFHLAAVATVTINWASFNGDWAWVTWAPGWACDVVVNAPITMGYVRAECTPTYNGVCQNYHIVVSAVGDVGSSAYVNGGIACGSPGNPTWATCTAFANAVCEGHAWVTLPAQPLICDAIVDDWYYELDHFVVECYNDP